MKKPWSICYWGGRPTCDWMFSQAYAKGANWNDTFWSHERFNKLLVQGRGELDPVKRAEIYREMQKIVRDEGGGCGLGLCQQRVCDVGQGQTWSKRCVKLGP